MESSGSVCVTPQSFWNQFEMDEVKMGSVNGVRGNDVHAPCLNLEVHPSSAEKTKAERRTYKTLAFVLRLWFIQY